MTTQQLEWNRIIAETLVEPHMHDDWPCYRTDCEEEN